MSGGNDYPKNNQFPAFPGLAYAASADAARHLCAAAAPG
jgi:hypothetical protein